MFIGSPSGIANANRLLKSERAQGLGELCLALTKRCNLVARALKRGGITRRSPPCLSDTLLEPLILLLDRPDFIGDPARLLFGDAVGTNRIRKLTVDGGLAPIQSGHLLTHCTNVGIECVLLCRKLNATLLLGLLPGPRSSNLLIASAARSDIATSVLIGLHLGATA